MLKAAYPDSVSSTKFWEEKGARHTSHILIVHTTLNQYDSKSFKSQHFPQKMVHFPLFPHCSQSHPPNPSFPQHDFRNAGLVDITELPAMELPGEIATRGWELPGKWGPQQPQLKVVVETYIFPYLSWDFYGDVLDWIWFPWFLRIWFSSMVQPVMWFIQSVAIPSKKVNSMRSFGNCKLGRFGVCC